MTKRSNVFFCASFASALVAVRVAGAQTDQELARRVIAIYGANQNAIRSVECDYTFHLNGITRQCRYARDGDRVYHASVDAGPEGRYSLPFEMAWDGQTVYRRSTIGMLTISREHAYAKPSCSPPERMINTYLAQALGYEPHPDQRYDLLSAKAVIYLHHDCVELRFNAHSPGGTLVSRHARQYNYAPISAEFIDQGGKGVYELSNVQYSTATSQGNAIYYPVHYTATAKGAIDNVFVYDVDRTTLHINSSIPVSRFKLTPFPCDQVTDLDNVTARSAADEQWSPAGKVGFPFDAFVGASPPVSDRHAPIDVFNAQRAAILAQEHRRLWLWVICAVAGVGLVLISVYFRLRQKPLKRT